MVTLMRWSALLLLSMVAVVAVVAAQANGSTGNGKVIEVVIKDFKFTPDSFTITPGTTVRWINREKRQYHSVWFEQLGEPEPDYLFPEESYERIFTGTGTFPYRCGPHPEMRGVVQVAE